MEDEEQRPMAPQTCCSGSATTAFMISGTYCFTNSLRTAQHTCHRRPCVSGLRSIIAQRKQCSTSMSDSHVTSCACCQPS